MFYQQQFLPEDQYNPSFDQSELDLIADLIDRIPLAITSGFEKKYLKWKNALNRYHSNPYLLAECIEYDELLQYCTPYGKSIWPLVFDKIAKGQEEYHALNLVKDLTYGGNMSFLSDIRPPGLYPSVILTVIDYTKKLLERELENIKQAIQELSEEEENSSITSNGLEVILNHFSDVETIAIVKIFNLSGGIEYESVYNVTKGRQNIIVDVSNLRKGLYVVQIAIGSKTASRKIII